MSDVIDISQKCIFSDNTPEIFVEIILENTLYKVGVSKESSETTMKNIKNQVQSVIKKLEDIKHLADKYGYVLVRKEEYEQMKTGNVKQPRVPQLSPTVLQNPNINKNLKIQYSSKPQISIAKPPEIIQNPNIQENTGSPMPNNVRVNKETVDLKLKEIREQEKIESVQSIDKDGVPISIPHVVSDASGKSIISIRREKVKLTTPGQLSDSPYSNQ